MGIKQTCSVSHGRCAAKHTARKFIPNNVYEEMIPENVHLIYQPVKEAFHEAFDDAVQEYNSKQKRADRKKNDYYQEILDGRYKEENGKKIKVMNAPNPEYEYVFQLGNRDSNPASILNEAGERQLGPYAAQSRAALKDFFEEFKKSNPNFHITGASIHMDEATPHLHVRFIPIGEGYKNGLSKRCCLTKALANMGFDRSSGRGNDLSILKWQEAQTNLLQKVGERHGFEIIEGNSKGRKHIENREWCAGKGDEITRLEKEAADYRLIAEHEEARAIAAHREAERQKATLKTTIQNKEEYDTAIAKIEDNQTGFLQLIISVFEELRRNLSAPEDVWKRSLEKFVLVVEAFENKIKDLLGYETLHNLSEDDRHAVKYQNTVDDILAKAKTSASEHNRNVTFDSEEITR